MSAMSSRRRRPRKSSRGRATPIPRHCCRPCRSPIRGCAAEASLYPILGRLAPVTVAFGGRVGDLQGAGAREGAVDDHDVPDRELRIRTAAFTAAAIRGGPETILLRAQRRMGEQHDARATGRTADETLGYCEVPIEQGPVLESLDLPLGVVLGTFGVERHSIRFIGQAAHSGSVADLLVFDPSARWRVDAATLASASSNTPLLGLELLEGSLSTLMVIFRAVAVMPTASPSFSAGG